MTINRQINRLLSFALKHELIGPYDYICAANHLTALLGLTEFTPETAEKTPDTADEILEKLLDYAVERGLIENTPSRRDLFDTLIMDQLTPRPSEIIRRFRQEYLNAPQSATDFFYNFSIAANYVRKSRTDRNRSWRTPTEYGDLQITINLSKPENDPRDIAAAKNQTAASYPKCLLCRENEGFFGTFSHPARQNLRLIPVFLGEEKWFLQYSPYVYYNEHCIILSDEHRPMKIEAKTFGNLLEFLDFLPHYFIGSNADLPIVGGSILSHDHYQGGRHVFPMDVAPVEKEYGTRDGVTLGRVKWPMSALRLRGKDGPAVIRLATKILEAWRGYSDETVGIVAATDDAPHNTITPIARKEGDDYVLHLVLRNNRSSAEFPLGIFHPHADVHNIKKENIGLIEVMGLAILPPRLLPELAAVTKALAENQAETAGNHARWYQELREELGGAAPQTIEAALEQKVGEKFARVLEYAGVFKRDEMGLAAFDRFVTHTIGGRHD